MAEIIWPHVWHDCTCHIAHNFPAFRLHGHYMVVCECTDPFLKQLHKIDQGVFCIIIFFFEYVNWGYNYDERWYCPGSRYVIGDKGNSFGNYLSRDSFLESHPSPSLPIIRMVIRACSMVVHPIPFLGFLSNTQISPTSVCQTLLRSFMSIYIMTRRPRSHKEKHLDFRGRSRH